jgi:hypothetical protein
MNKPQIDRSKLTPVACKMLDMLIERNIWISRKELARALKRGYLTNYQIKLLEDMTDQELIEVRRYTPYVKALAYEYRVKQQ